MPEWAWVTTALAAIGATALTLVGAAVKAYALRWERHLSANHTLRNTVSDELAKMQVLALRLKERIDNAHDTSTTVREEVALLRLEVAEVRGGMKAIQVVLEAMDR